MGIYEKLMTIQSELKAPKSQYNAFGKYAYRNCEDILESLKPLMKKTKSCVIISDNVEQIGGRQYVKAMVTFIDVESGESVENCAFAREEESKKGMDGSQVTGASSSYARKYALNGLFGIDDTKDSDTTNKPATEKPKEYVCAECGKKFDNFTDKNGKMWTAGQLYHMAENKSSDHIARCKSCREAADKK